MFKGNKSNLQTLNYLPTHKMINQRFDITTIKLAVNTIIIYLLNYSSYCLLFTN